jgi:hypothetical protein
MMRGRDAIFLNALRGVVPRPWMGRGEGRRAAQKPTIFVIGVSAQAKLQPAAESMTKSTACNELDDYGWLTGAEAADLTAQIAASSEPIHRVLERLRRRVSPERARQVMELVDLRRRAAAKFGAAGRMFFTRTALEQATDEWVAAYKASRFPQSATVADLCCGIGGDLLGLTRQGPVVGVDSNPIVAHLAAANARSILSPADAARVEIRVDDVERFELADFAAWHIDPDRRPKGVRISSFHRSRPSRATVERLVAACPNAAIKLAPAARVPAEWETLSELEWISRDGECRQLIAWRGKLATCPGERRATVVWPKAGGVETRSVVGQRGQSIPVVASPDRFVYDCDPGVLAAGLAGVLAAEHGLAAFNARPTYLTGATAIRDAALSCFEVTDVLPLREKFISTLLRERRIGQLEIKKRGVRISPEKLRKSLKLRSDRAAVLLITPVSGRVKAILARRIGADDCRE